MFRGLRYILAYSNQLLTKNSFSISPSEINRHMYDMKPQNEWETIS